MNSRTQLAQQALAAAGRIRLKAGRDTASPICVYDLVVDHFGDKIELRFQALPTLEGMYSRADGGSIIVVSTLRPSGRQRYTAAHELGHHIFGHGTRLDELIDETREDGFSPEEFVANTFAGFLLMPQLAVLKSFNQRSLTLDHAGPHEFYRIASAFGVGYTTLLGHLSRTCKVLPLGRAAQLAKVTPKKIRADILGRDIRGELHLVDEHWSGRAIDASVGDYVLLPRHASIEGAALKFVQSKTGGDLYEAVLPGIARVARGAWSSYARVARHQYVGRAVFRHEEECDD